MKKPYVPPSYLAEKYEMVRSVSSCSAIRINYISTGCVLTDSDSTPGMVDLALKNGFLAEGGCALQVTDPDPGTGDGICYHTSAAMAFTS